jgi:aspartate aminotransferase-like enzyme
MAEICRAFQKPCAILKSEWGMAVLPEELEKKLGEEGFAAVAVTHVDTSTGACAPVREYAKVLERRDILYIVDGVCATGGIEERMDEWGIDVVLTAAQKCFGVPPGLAILVLSERAIGKRKRLESVPAYYSDILRWLPVMKDPSRYFSTHCVNEIRAFYESTNIILEEGLEPRFRRHLKFAGAIRAGLASLGFTSFTREPFLAATLSVFLYPEGVEDQAFRRALYENGVVVAGGLGPTAGKLFRMGHMGNLSLAQVYFALETIEATLIKLGHGFEPGASLKSARSILEV